MKIQQSKLSQLHLNSGQIPGLPKNPRFIRDEVYSKLKKSIEDNPEMLELREVIAYPYDGKLIVICGNMRLRACRELKMNSIPTKVLSEDTSIDKLKAYTIKDNLPYGQWDMDLLANDWDMPELEELGFNLEELGLDEPSPELNNDPIIGEQFMVVIECDDENQQIKLLTKFQGEGLKCKALIS